MYTKKHFEDIAEVLRSVRPGKQADYAKITHWRHIRDNIAINFFTHNNNFDTEKFIKATEK